MPLYPNISFIYKNNGDLTFTNMAKEWDFNTRSFSNGAAYADLDNDGAPDLIVNNINAKAFIYKNNARSVTDNHFLSIVLKGKGMNTRGIGARVTVYYSGQQQIDEQFPTRGFLSASSDVLHFGLGKAKKIDSLNVRWPDMSEQMMKNVFVDTSIRLDMTNASKPVKKELPVNDKLFSSVQIPGLAFTHKEDEWVDFYREKLIPHSLSIEGPAIAVGDVNGDGLQDLFVGGAKGHAATIFLQQKNGSFKQSDIPVLTEEIYLDDVDAAFFDADGDGNLDLYIARGGNEALIGNPLLTDLLLINDGKGNFTKGELPFMSHNGSCVRPCDFDGDGDIDLFVGSRSVPGAYGLSPDQFLLENDGHGHFKIVSDDRIKAFKNIGMVTDASWIDWDKDGQQDLVIAGEWMNVSIFKNDKGYFTDVTVSAGLNETSGWWNCIRALDVDGDGNIDLIGGNLGLNSYLKASLKEPVEMYLNDFDNNGSLDQVICTYQNGISYPFASLDELSAQITGLDKKYPRYSDFGGKTVIDIFGKSAIDKSILKKAVLFESCLFHNKGDGIFEIKKLPVEAQFSPVRDIVVKDINMDSKQDLILVGNDYAVRPSYGRYDASFGWCLLRDTNNEFKTLLPVKSGLRINGDARKLVPIDIAGKHYLIVAVNNGKLQIFQILK